MRFAPAAAALSLFLATTASMSSAGEPKADPRAEMLISQGEMALEAGDTQGAIDAFEAAFFALAFFFFFCANDSIKISG